MDKVIHVCLPEDRSSTDSKVQETPLSWFLAGGTDEQVVDAEPAYAYEEVVRRARRYVGAAGYMLPTRNCEHFASWCFKGSSLSKQVQGFGIGAGVMSACFAVLAIVAISMSRTQWVS
jgi:hypothetical protein